MPKPDGTIAKAPRARATLDHYVGWMDNTHGDDTDREPTKGHAKGKQPNWTPREPKGEGGEG